MSNTPRFRKLLIVVLIISSTLVLFDRSSPARGIGPRWQGTAQPTPAGDLRAMSELDRELAQLQMQPEGPADRPWEQMLQPIDLVDTSAFRKAPPWHVCFSNSSVSNTWRVLGWALMQYEVKQHPEIASFTVIDALDRADKQILDIRSLLSQSCDVLIIAPTISTSELAAAVEQAAATGIPVIVFDHGVPTTRYTTFIHPIGGFASGYSSAKWLAEALHGKGNVLAIRLAPYIEQLDARWQAAKAVFDTYPDIRIVGPEFAKGDATRAMSIVFDYVQRWRTLDGVWVDFGGISPAVYQAFVSMGKPAPLIVGEDYNGWLKLWQKNKLDSISPTYPVFQWRTAIIAAVHILKGEPVPKTWVLPQPTITNDTVDNYVRRNLPDEHWVLCGCDTMLGFLDALWEGQ